jgi:hypothetical protein
MANPSTPMALLISGRGAHIELVFTDVGQLRITLSAATGDPIMRYENNDKDGKFMLYFTPGPSTEHTMQCTFPIEYWHYYGLSIHATDSAFVAIHVSRHIERTIYSLRLHASNGGNIIASPLSRCTSCINFMEMLVEGKNSNINLSERIGCNVASIIQSGNSNTMQNIVVNRCFFSNIENTHCIRNVIGKVDSCKRIISTNEPVVNTLTPATIAIEDKLSMERNQCTICKRHYSDVVFFPCKHICVCGGCFMESQTASEPMTTCPYCRNTIVNTVQAFIV